jgi:septal ring factor EnvC (AmiA/AmiB activator)
MAYRKLLLERDLHADQTAELRQELQEAMNELKVWSKEHDTVIADLRITDDKLKKTNDLLKKTKEKLKAFGDELKNTKDELKNTKDELKNVKDESNNTKDKLKASEDELKKSREEIKGLKKSVVTLSCSRETTNIKLSGTVGTLIEEHDLKLPAGSKRR